MLCERQLVDEWDQAQHRFNRPMSSRDSRLRDRN
jgi:hypothetical protein